MSMIQVKPAGQAVPKVEKRAVESILYTLNCDELLEQNELIVRVDMPAVKPGISITDLRPRKGRSIELRVDNESLNNSAYIDYNLQVLFYTTFNNCKSAVMQLKVHK